MHGPFFNVTLLLRIHANHASMSSDDIWLERRTVLPFPPFEGLTIEHWSAGNQDHEVTKLVRSTHRNSQSGIFKKPLEIHWIQGSDEFVVYLVDETLYHWYDDDDESNPPPTVTSIAKAYIERGWRLTPESTEKLQREASHVAEQSS